MTDMRNVRLNAWSRGLAALCHGHYQVIGSADEDQRAQGAEEMILMLFATSFAILSLREADFCTHASLRKLLLR